MTSLDEKLSRLQSHGNVRSLSTKTATDGSVLVRAIIGPGSAVTIRLIPTHYALSVKRITESVEQFSARHYINYSGHERRTPCECISSAFFSFYDYFAN